MKKLINKFLLNFGYSIISSETLKILKNQSKEVRNTTIQGGLNRLVRNKINPDIVVDIGAAKGSWTVVALNYWPNAKYHLIEPLKEQLSQLHPNLKAMHNINIIEGVAGEINGQTKLNISNDLDGSGVYGKSSNSRIVQMHTVDSFLSQEKGDVMLKLDTHGYELPILEGSLITLKRTISVIVEVYGFYISPTTLLFHELSANLKNYGFRLFDIVDILHRPKDKAFWQADAIFIRDDHPIFEDNFYS